MSGPSFWQDVGGDRTWQYRRAIQDPSDQMCEGTLGDDIPSCCNGLPPAGSTPTVSLHVVGKRIMVDYNAPGFYCTDTGEWPPEYTCTNDPEGATDRVSLFDGVGTTIRRAYVYFEDGIWDTGIDIPSCGQTANYQASIKYLTGGGLVTAFSAITALTATCLDRDGGPAGGCGGTSAGPPTVACPTAGLPINVGSGDVMVRQPLFTVAQEPMSLPFTLTYHSEAALFPALVSSPVGLGWTHDYAQTLRPEDGTNNRLYHITAEGYEHEYLRISPDNSWIAINPAELRGTINVSANVYQLTDLDGTVTSFDVPTGRWNSTKDRWGNTISGTYNGSGQLITITDSMGRQIQLAYTTGQVTVTPGGNVWKLLLTGTLLTSIRDPLHSTTNWRTYTYVNDHSGTQRLLSSIKDDASQQLEAHTYDNGSGGTDRALTSSQDGGTPPRSNVSITYDTATQRTVTHTIDGSTTQTTTFSMGYLGGRWLPITITGNCATCGGSDTDLQIFAYDYSNHIIDRKDGSGSDQVETQYTYATDGNPFSIGRPISKVEAVGRPEQRTTSYAYGYVPPSGPAWQTFLTKVTEQSAANPGQTKTTTYTWNSSGTPETTLTLVTTGYLPGPPPTQVSYTTTSTYNPPRHRLTKVTGPATNQQVTYAYYADGDATVERRGRLSTSGLYTSSTAHLDTTYDIYDVFGNAKKVVDPNGVETDKTTDGRGRLLTVVSKKPANDPNEAADYMTTYTYDTRDRLAKVTLPRSNQIHYVYEDGTNRLTDTIRADSSGNEQERLHLTLNVIGDKSQEDSQVCTSTGNPCLIWGTPPRRTENFKYDTHNRLSETDHPDGSKIVYGYDTRGNLTQIQDERHTAANTIYAYDSLNRLTKVTQKQTIVPGPDIITQYGYDVQDNLTSVTDPNSNQTTYNYDDFRRLQKEINPVRGAPTYSYDPAGNLLTTTDANGATTSRTYDPANRVLTSTSTGGTDISEVTTWAYDDGTIGNYGLGRVASMTDPSGTTKYIYDRRGLLRSERRALWDSQEFLTMFGLDANGNRTSITYPSGRVVMYAYDFADRQTQANSTTPSAQTYVSGAVYEPFGPIKQITYGNGAIRDVTWTNRYLMQENKLSKAPTTVADLKYGTDVVGNITSICESASGCPGTLLGYDRSFAFDDLNRLTTAKAGPSLWGNGATNGYVYDAMGNIASMTLGTMGMYRKATFSYAGTLPKLSSVTEEPPLITRAVQYDAAGNESQVGSGGSAKVYEYSARNFLSVGEGLSYSYDGRGVRVVTRQQGLAVTSLSPSSGAAGVGITLKVGGTGFVTGTSQIWWNNATHATTFNSPTELTATITAAQMPGAGTIVPVQVKNGASASNTVNFVVNFLDVPSTDPFYPFIITIAGHGVTSGCGSGNYCPNSTVTRDSMAVFLLKSKEGSAYNPPPCTGIFADVPCPNGFAVNFIEEIFRRGITSGCGGGNYCPTNPVTRASMAVFLLRTLEGPGYAPPTATGTVFSDVHVGDFAADWIEELAHRGITAGCSTGSPPPYCPSSSVTRASMAVFLTKTFGFTSTFSVAGFRRGFIYSPELSLLSETEYVDYATNRTAQILYEYIWMAGAPVAQVDSPGSGGTVHWTLTDHLGTPFLQTNSDGTTLYWRAEYEPYGRLFTLRTTNQHQVLRLPGQEAEELSPLSSDGNGNTERFYNIFRWYKDAWGRYSQSDPVNLAFIRRQVPGSTADQNGPHLFSYAAGNPLGMTDRLGLRDCGRVPERQDFTTCPLYCSARKAHGECVLSSQLGSILVIGGVVAIGSGLFASFEFTPVGGRCVAAGVGAITLSVHYVWERGGKAGIDADFKNCTQQCFSEACNRPTPGCPVPGGPSVGALVVQ